jgi:maltooligosyltrehalose trehalohydrolase
MKRHGQIESPRNSKATADSAKRTLGIAAPVRRFPVGAEVQPGGGTHFRVWAPVRKRIEVVLEGSTGDRSEACLLEPQEGGYFEGLVEWAQPGFRYRFKLDDDERHYPDPASRWQPDGPHGPSVIVDPGKFQWHDQEWRGPGLKGQVLYEIHVGTFTEGGTFRSAVHELPALAELGITMLELMPVADFPGDFGWGYDGVCLYAPYHRYGSPDDLRTLIDTAHQLGMGIILDVVYNHIGPDGNYLTVYTPDYFTSRYKNEWGEAINFDGPNAAGVREFFKANAGYWIEEFHFDGLRLDATQQIFDQSEPNVLLEIGQEARHRAGSRTVIVVVENEPQDTRLIRPMTSGGFGLDAAWNDDFHHSAMVALTSRNDAYYTDYEAHPQEFISALKWGYLYQGQRYKWQKQRRGTPALDLPPEQFVLFIQNHDQIANSASGQRCHQVTSPGLYRAMTALLLLAPGTPMLFQGQEFAAASPFHYFADHNPDLAILVEKGRLEFLSQFRNLALPEVQSRLPHPSDEATFMQCKLDHSEREQHREAYRLHYDLLALRRTDARFSEQRKGGFDGAVLSENAFLLRFLDPAGLDDRLLIVNLGRDLHLDPAPEPLLAPPWGQHWETAWSSEDPVYGGEGTAALDTEDENWRIPGKAAVVLKPTPLTQKNDATPNAQNPG